MTTEPTPEKPRTDAEWEAHWAFYKLAIEERDYERTRYDQLTTWTDQLLANQTQPQPINPNSQPTVTVESDGTLTLTWPKYAGDVIMVHRAVLEGMVEAHNKYVAAHPITEAPQRPQVGAGGAAKVLAQLQALERLMLVQQDTLEQHRERMNAQDERIKQLHTIVRSQGERLNRLDNLRDTHDHPVKDPKPFPGTF